MDKRSVIVACLARYYLRFPGTQHNNMENEEGGNAKKVLHLNPLVLYFPRKPLPLIASSS